VHYVLPCDRSAVSAGRISKYALRGWECVSEVPEGAGEGTMSGAGTASTAAAVDDVGSSEGSGGGNVILARPKGLLPRRWMRVALPLVELWAEASAAVWRHGYVHMSVFTAMTAEMVAQGAGAWKHVVYRAKPEMG
jgi:hypothetical protein